MLLQDQCKLSCCTHVCFQLATDLFCNTNTRFRQLQVITEAMQVLRGCEYGRGSMAAALHGLRPQFVEEGPRKSLDAMTEWMVSSVDD